MSEGAARRARDQTMKGAASERPRCKRAAGERRDGSGRGRLGGECRVRPSQQVVSEETVGVERRELLGCQAGG